MLKYKYVNVVFSEIPEEVTLAVSITGCKIHCDGCHSKELWEDVGTPLTTLELDRLLDEHGGVTCLLLLGGEQDIDSLTDLFWHAYRRIKTAWYCGLDTIPKDKIGILQYLDYVKIGSYKKDLGGLASPTTNQRLYHITHRDEGLIKADITHKLQHNEIHRGDMA